ncbi:zinc-ribbon domain-containing protein [Clostridium estertheticum]|uniref:zinc ribbon domain-containing protein n=1 Tax=Clostridium estertheticum TaxID=238834 RepID=UPI001C6E49B7|nr:zinc ribbon domain-containing protein [Clostridium estertheticum]MBW9173344.1 zinc-ribbon domain-containing protein [Clostridium estertheticum]WLC73408.1 zinc-ribbon domain-containing protein [Clostridium estertheticum]
MAFKDSFSKITKSLSDGASNVVQKSNDLIEISKLNAEIDIIEKKKEIIYLGIGKLVYNSYITKVELKEEIKNKCDDLIEYDEEIKKIREQIFNVKKIKKCPNCGIKIDIDTSFCPNCGNKQELVKSNNSAEFSDSIEDDDTL